MARRPLGRRVRVAGAGALLAAAATVVFPGSAGAAPMSESFTCTEGEQIRTVPASVTEATFRVDGSVGGDSTGGLGGRAEATLTVVPGTVYTLVVGCFGESYNGQGFGGTGGFGFGRGGRGGSGAPAGKPRCRHQRR